MDSKQMPEEELPPPYSVHVGDHVSSSQSTQEVSLTSHLQQHLTSLPNRIRMNREAHSVQQSLDDASLVDLLLPEIEDFLAYLGGLHNAPKLAHLTLVPETAVAQDAVLSGMEDMHRRGEICRVARVKLHPNNDEKKSTTTRDSKEGASTSQDWSVGREFSDWGRFGDSTSSTDSSQGQSMLWWRDEDMAQRLARHLQPLEEPAPLKTSVQETVEERLPAQKPKKGWFWGRKGSTSSSTSTYATKTVQADVESFPGRGASTQTTAQKGREQDNTGAKMSVTAEEVAFRIENNLGIVESARGWAVMVAVHVKT
ncbi:hypothetical protein FHL15_006844 [Xylaria flabelliformis]|uniref:Uncharacterized protein n=1 Tax=Xylaria flabelliformis TaxID=2512241 RepID=A0A553HW96_9PEZI|nr:hypothetical protein FHL15_006844 [Xylaria flabelliformis]